MVTLLQARSSSQEGESLRIGVLGYQGSVRAHAAALESCGVKAVLVRYEKDLEQISGLVLPGGESTTLLKLFSAYGLDQPIRARIANGMPVYGTCAGLILLAKEVVGGLTSPLAAMDIVAHRNAYGRQIDSFVAEVPAPALGEKPFHAVFIRAPRIAQVSPNVQVLAEWDNQPVAARQGNLLVSSFHPEITGDFRFHQYFVDMVRNTTSAVSQSRS